MARDLARRRMATSTPQLRWRECRTPCSEWEPKDRCRNTGQKCMNRADCAALRWLASSRHGDAEVVRCRKSWGSPTRGRSRAMKRPSRTSGGILAVTAAAVHTQRLSRRVIRPLGECSAGAARLGNSGTSPDPGEHARRKWVWPVPTRQRRSFDSQALDAAGTC